MTKGTGMTNRRARTTGRRNRICGLNNKVFASKYKLALPSEKELRLKLKSIPKMLERKK